MTIAAIVRIKTLPLASILNVTAVPAIARIYLSENHNFIKNYVKSADVKNSDGLTWCSILE